MRTYLELPRSGHVGWVQSRFGIVRLAAALLFVCTTLPAFASEPAPTISPSYWLFSSGPQTVSISDSDGSAVIHYTTDGTQPSSGSPTYSTSFSVSAASTTIQAIAIGGSGTSAVTASVVQIDANAANVLGVGGYFCWLRADNGPIVSGSNVVQWTNINGGSVSFTQSTGTAQPTLVSGAINSLPAVAFNGSTEFLQNATNLAGLNNGFSVFVVAKPVATVPANATLFDLGNDGTDDTGIREPSSTGAEFFAYNGASSSSVTAANAITPGQFQLLESIGGDPSTTDRIWTNGVQDVYGPVNQLNDNTRVSNSIGVWHDGTGFFNGQIAEIIMFNSILTSQQRAWVEGYLSNRYALAVPPPVISPTTGVYNTLQQVTITAGPTATINITTDGSTPTGSSPVYSSPINLTGSTVVNAIATQNSLTSPVASSYIQADPNSAAIPRSGLTLWFRSDFGLTTVNNSVTQWVDMSGNTVATQADTSIQPGYIACDVNGLPAVSFNGISQNMTVGPIFSYFTGGSLFALIKPSALTSGATLIDIANGTASDNIILNEPDSSGDVQFHVFNGSSDSSIETSGGVMSVGNYVLQEAIQSGSGTATLYANGTQTASGSVNNPNSLIRSSNFLGARNTGGNLFPGNLIELIFYDRAVTAAEQGNIEAYLLNRAQVYNQPPPSPTFSLAAGALAAPSQLAIEVPAGVTCLYTTDGTAPSLSSNVYTSQIPINFSQTVKAITVKNGLQSSVVSAAYTLDSTQWPAPSGSATTPVNLNLQLPTMAIPQ